MFGGHGDGRISDCIDQLDVELDIGRRYVLLLDVHEGKRVRYEAENSGPLGQAHGIRMLQCRRKDSLIRIPGFAIAHFFHLNIPVILTDDVIKYCWSKNKIIILKN